MKDVVEWTLTGIWFTLWMKGAVTLLWPWTTVMPISALIEALVKVLL